MTHSRYPTYCNLDRLIVTFEHFSILQIAEQLQLTPSILLTELANGKINFSDSNRTLRENFPIMMRENFRRDHYCIEVTFQSQPKRMFQWKRNCFASPLVWLCLPAYAENVFTLGQIEVIGEKASDLSTARIDQAELQKTTKIVCLM